MRYKRYPLLRYSRYHYTDIFNRALKDYERELLIKSCDYDLFKVEATVRGLISKNTPVKRVMEAYRILHGKLTKNTISDFNLREMIA